MRLGDVVWWRFKDHKPWKLGTVRGFPAEGLIKLHLSGMQYVVVSELDIEWKDSSTTSARA